MFKKTLIILISLLGVIDSSYTLIIYNRIIGSQFAYKSICAISEFVNCDVVITSRFGKILGIPSSVYGIITYSAIALFSIIHFLTRKPERRVYYSYLFGISLFTSLLSIYLFAISLLVIKALCLMCIGLYIINFSLLTISTIEVVREKLSPLKLFYEHALFMFKEKTLLSIAGIIGVASTILFLHYHNIEKEKKEWRERYSDFFNKTSPVYDIEIGESPVTGSPDAKVTIVEFSDFQCPFCKNADQSIDNLLQKYEGKIRYVFKHFPLDKRCNYLITRTVHEHACESAIASLCAEKQGKFWEYKKLLFKNQKELSVDKLLEIAEEAGLEMAEFKTCLDSPGSIIQRIVSDIHQGYELGVRSTPTLYINGRMIKGAPPYWLLEEMVAIDLR